MDNKAELLERIEEALNEVRPHLAIDGGDVELVDVTEDYVVQVRWKGNCRGCNMTEMTLRAGIEQTVKNRISEINSVIALNE